MLIHQLNHLTHFLFIILLFICFWKGNFNCSFCMQDHRWRWRGVTRGKQGEWDWKCSFNKKQKWRVFNTWSMVFVAALFSRYEWLREKVFFRKVGGVCFRLIAYTCAWFCFCIGLWDTIMRKVGKWGDFSVCLAECTMYFWFQTWCFCLSFVLMFGSLTAALFSIVLQFVKFATHVCFHSQSNYFI